MFKRSRRSTTARSCACFFFKLPKFYLIITYITTFLYHTSDSETKHQGCEKIKIDKSELTITPKRQEDLKVSCFVQNDNFHLPVTDVCVEPSTQLCQNTTSVRIYCKLQVIYLFQYYSCVRTPPV